MSTDQNIEAQPKVEVEQRAKEWHWASRRTAREVVDLLNSPPRTGPGEAAVTVRDGVYDIFYLA